MRMFPLQLRLVSPIIHRTSRTTRGSLSCTMLASTTWQCIRAHQLTMNCHDNFKSCHRLATPYRTINEDSKKKCHRLVQIRPSVSLESAATVSNIVFSECISPLSSKAVKLAPLFEVSTLSNKGVIYPRTDRQRYPSKNSSRGPVVFFSGASSSSSQLAPQPRRTRRK